MRLLQALRLGSAVTKNLTLFDVVDTQIEDAVNQHFDCWLTHRQSSTSNARRQRALLDESAYIYREMWRSFAKFCGQQNITLADLTVTDLETFLLTRGSGPDVAAPRMTTAGAYLSPRYANRYLVLIENVTKHKASVDDVMSNHAAALLRERPEFRYAEAADKDPPPEYLDEMQARRLITHLTRAPQPESNEKMTWKTVRDRSAVSLMLGGGLTPYDLRNLKLDGVISVGGRRTDVPWKLSLQGNGNSPARETPLADWAGRQLAFWLRIRSQQGIPGPWLFPSTMKGTQWSNTRCFDACRSVLESAKIGNDSGGLFKLRHTFALRQMRKGKDEADVARWLGFLDSKSMDHYKRIVMTYQDVS